MKQLLVVDLVVVCTEVCVGVLVGCVGVCGCVCWDGVGCLELVQYGVCRVTYKLFRRGYLTYL